MPGNNVLVSICTITYNHEQYIAKALDSCLAQKTNFDFEIVIGEDRSTDKTWDIILEYKKKFPDKIRLLSNDKNIGSMSNFMRTFTACTGKYVAFCEGDDFWSDPYKLQKQIDFLEAHSNYVICFHDVDILDETNSNSGIVSKQNVKTDSDIYDIIKENYIYTVSCVCRKVIAQFPEWMSGAMLGDWLLYVLLCENNGKMHYLPEKMAVYRVHSGGIFSTNNSMDYTKQLNINNKLIFQYTNMIQRFHNDVRIAHELDKKLLGALNKLRFLSLASRDFKTTRRVSASIVKKIPVLFNAPSLYISALISLSAPGMYSNYLKKAQ